jgi:hypothetical protein
MIRKRALDESGYYSPEIPSCEDYELWTRLAGKYKTWNLQENFVLYRLHSESDTAFQKEKRQKMFSLIYSKMFERLGFDYNEDELSVNYMIYNNNFIPTLENIEKIKRWLVKLNAQNKEKKILDQICFSEVISEKWFDICYFSSTNLGSQIWKEYWNFPLVKRHKQEFIKLLKFLIRCKIGKKVKVK